MRDTIRRLPLGTKVAIYAVSIVVLGLIGWAALSLLGVEGALPIAILVVVVAGVALPALQRVFAWARS